MLAPRDLAEADAHERRRLVTAFVRGGDGREVDPPRTGRLLVAGAALCLAVVATVVILELVRPSPSVDWQAPGLVVVAETGARYVVLEDGAAPRPVANLVSARLLLGGADAPAIVPAGVVSARGPGPPVGIPGAPETVPTAAGPGSWAWTACASSGNQAPEVTTGPAAAVASGAPNAFGAGQGRVVEDPAGGLHLVATSPDGTARRFAFDDLDLLHRTDLRGGQVVAVAAGWLDLLPAGPSLQRKALEVTGAGGRPDYADAIHTRGGTAPEVGDLVLLDGQHYLLGRHLPFLLSSFAARVHELTTGRAARPIDGLGVTAQPLRRVASWPDRFPVPLADGAACVVLDGRDRLAVPRLVTRPEPRSEPRSSDERALAVDSPTTGSLVRGTDRQADRTWLVDATGTRHLLGGSADLAALGYAGVESVGVPGEWLALFTCGVELSRDAAAAAERRPACRSAE